mgnify:CR=1 FL=1
MLVAFLISLAMATGSGPMHAALEATEAPDTLRAAFTVELVSNSANHTYLFDPRLPPGARLRPGQRVRGRDRDEHGAPGNHGTDDHDHRHGGRLPARNGSGQAPTPAQTIQTAAAARPRLKSLEPWGGPDKLDEEIYAVGFFLSGHPLDDYMAPLKRKGVMTLPVIRSPNRPRTRAHSARAISALS